MTSSSINCRLHVSPSATPLMVSHPSSSSQVGSSWFGTVTVENLGPLVPSCVYLTIAYGSDLPGQGSLLPTAALTTHT